MLGHARRHVGRALGGTCIGVDMRASLKGCSGRCSGSTTMSGEPDGHEPGRQSRRPRADRAVGYVRGTAQLPLRHGEDRDERRRAVLRRPDQHREQLQARLGRHRRLVRLHRAMVDLLGLEQRHRPLQHLDERGREAGHHLEREEGLGRQRRRRQLRPLHPRRAARRRREGPRLGQLDRADLLDRGLPRRHRDRRDDRVAAGHRLRRAELRGAVLARSSAWARRPAATSRPRTAGCRG